MEKFKIATLILSTTLVLGGCGKDNESMATNERVINSTNINGENIYEENPEEDFQIETESFKKIQTEPKLSLSITNMALKNDGSLYGWGSNNSGQLGNGTSYKYDEKVPVYLPYLNGFKSVESAGFFTLAIKEDGTVWGWGENQNGQLCDGTTQNQLNPVQAQGIDNVTAITTYLDTVLALKEDGTVWMWGENKGFWHIFKEEYTCIPVQVPNIDNAIDISIESDLRFILKSDGTIWKWGTDKSGIKDEWIQYPEQIQGIDNVIAIDSDDSHTLALKSDGTVWGWGRNSDLFGNTDYFAGATSVPTQIPNLTGIKKIVADGYGNFALKEDGTVWSWGNNLYGTLGERNTDSQTPGQILNFGDVIDIEAYYGVAMAIKEDGTVWAWGKNEDGEISENARNQYTQQIEKKITVPVQIEGIDLIE